MTRIIQTGITKEILSGDNHPQIQIGEKLYVVDDRKSTYDKLSKIQSDEKLSAEEKEKQMFILALGKEAQEEIYSFDLPVDKFDKLTYCIMGAMTGKEPDDIEKKVNEQLEKNL